MKIDAVPQLIVIAGPCKSGKTKTLKQISRHTNAHLIQSLDEMENIPQGCLIYCMDNVNQYDLSRLIKVIDDLLKKKKIIYVSFELTVYSNTIGWLNLFENSNEEDIQVSTFLKEFDTLTFLFSRCDQIIKQCGKCQCGARSVATAVSADTKHGMCVQCIVHDGNMPFSKEKQTGSITLITGPMFAGKSTKLVELGRTLSNSYCVKSNIDNRYDLQSIVTHDQAKKDCKAVVHLSEVSAEMAKHDNVIIDEAQFFKMINFLMETMHLVTQGKNFYIAGLNSSFEKTGFNVVTALLYIANVVDMKLSSCFICQSPAMFSYRIGDSRKNIEAGTEYHPMCRQHYDENYVPENI